MYRLTWLKAAAPCTLLVALAACSSDNSIGTTPTQNSTTIEFTGTLTSGGAASYSFAGLAAGQVSAQLADLNPATITDNAGNQSNVAVGLQLGVWDGNACDGKVSNDKIVKSTSVVANETAAGSLCVRIYDSTGALPPPSVNYDILVTHP